MLLDYDGPLLAASRDASCWDRPNTRSPKKVHVAVEVQIMQGFGGFEGDTLVGEAACDPGRMPLDMSSSDRAETWPASRRCKRKGCAARWPAYRDSKTTRQSEATSG